MIRPWRLTNLLIYLFYNVLFDEKRNIIRSILSCLCQAFAMSSDIKNALLNLQKYLLVEETSSSSRFLKIKIAVTVRRGISELSHEKIWNCEQSNSMTISSPTLAIKIIKE